MGRQAGCFSGHSSRDSESTTNGRSRNSRPTMRRLATFLVGRRYRSRQGKSTNNHTYRTGATGHSSPGRRGAGNR